MTVTKPKRRMPASIDHYVPPAIKDDSFSTIRQGNATNTLTKIKPKEGENLLIDPITGVATISQGDLSLSIADFNNLFSGLKTSTYKLLDALTVMFTEGGAKSTTVSLSLDEYMAKCGLKDKKEARKQVKNDLESLYNLSLSFKGVGADPDFYSMRICDAQGIKNGIITFNFAPTFYNLLAGYPVMPYPAQLWRLNAQYNPNSFYLLRKIAEHKNMNIGKKNEDIIAVKTLLSATPYIPTYKEVMQKDKHVDQRIIQPFERDMNALGETLSWEYCKRNGDPIPEEELQQFSYQVFIKLLIHTMWTKYPERKK